MKKDDQYERAFSLVANLIYQVKGILPVRINVHDSLINDLAMDSVELIDLIMQLEVFGVIMQEEQITKDLTVGNIVYLVHKEISL